MDKIELVVFTRAGCHLCEALLEELDLFCSTGPYTFQTVEISGNEKLEQQYGLKVPVVTYEHDTLCEFFLDVNKIEEYFDKAGN